MEVGKLSVQFRSDSGKTAARRLRAQGMIPAVCYGGGGEPVLLALEPAKLMKALDPVKKTNTVIKLDVAGAPAGNEELTVMLREYQKDVLRGDLTHADFIRVDLTKEVHAEVPVILTGKAVGVVDGGILHQVIRRLEIACTPDRIPDKLQIDVTALALGEALHVRDLNLGEGVRALTDGGNTVCSVTAPRAEKVAEAVVAEGAAAEGAAAATAEAAKGAAGAKGAAAGAKPAAAKPAAGGKEGGGDKKGK